MIASFKSPTSPEQTVTRNPMISPTTSRFSLPAKCRMSEMISNDFVCETRTHRNAKGISGRTVQQRNRSGHPVQVLYFPLLIPSCQSYLLAVVVGRQSGVKMFNCARQGNARFNCTSQGIVNSRCYLDRRSSSSDFHKRSKAWWCTCLSNDQSVIVCEPLGSARDFQ